MYIHIKINCEIQYIKSFFVCSDIKNRVANRYACSVEISSEQIKLKKGKCSFGFYTCILCIYSIRSLKAIHILLHHYNIFSAVTMFFILNWKFKFSASCHSLKENYRFDNIWKRPHRSICQAKIIYSSKLCGFYFLIIHIRTILFQI